MKLPLEPHACCLEVERRRLRLPVAGRTRALARLHSQLDDLAVLPVAEGDPRQPGQRIALAASVVGGAGERQRLLVALP